MFIPDLVGGIANALHDIGEALDIFVDQAAIDKVLETLEQNHQELQGSRFPDLHLPAAAFGTTGSAIALGGHHSKAHEVVRETLEGVLNDLNRFREGLVHAEKLVQEADTGTAADLDKKRAAADLLVIASHHSEGDRRNNEIRHQLGEEGARP